MLRESKTLEKTAGEIKNGQPRKTGNIRYTNTDEDKQSKNQNQTNIDNV